jgi:porin
MRIPAAVRGCVLAAGLSAGASASAYLAVEVPEPIPGYGGDFRSRSKLTGDWGGARSQWASKGFTADVDFTGTYQNVVAGGADETGDFIASSDLLLEFDTGKLGLWPGGFLVTRIEVRFGDPITEAAGTLQPVNADALFPLVPGRADEDVWAVSELVFTQFLTPKFGIFGGLINGQEGDSNELAGNPGSDAHFLNGAFRFALIGATVPGAVPMVTLGGGVVFIPNERIFGSVIVMDTEESSGLNPFDTDEGTTIATEWTLRHELGGQSGGQVFGLAYSFDNDFVAIGEKPRLNIPRATGAISPPTDDDAWAFYYNVYQYLRSEGSRKWGVFGRFGITEGEVSIDWDMAVGIGGKGIFGSRPKDTFGVGYYYTAAADVPLLRVVGVDDEQGVEVWYNFEVTPWFHVTADLQVVDPGLQGNALVKGSDTSWVLGVRTHLNF